MERPADGAVLSAASGRRRKKKVGGGGGGGGGRGSGWDVMWQASRERIENNLQLFLGRRHGRMWHMLLSTCTDTEPSAAAAAAAA